MRPLSLVACVDVCFLEDVPTQDSVGDLSTLLKSTHGRKVLKVSVLAFARGKIALEALHHVDLSGNKLEFFLYVVHELRNGLSLSKRLENLLISKNLKVVVDNFALVFPQL